MNVLVNSGRAIPFFGTRRKLISEIVTKADKVILTGYQTGYEKQIQEIGASFIQTPLERSGFNPFKDLKLLIAYYNIIRQNKIDIVHSYTIKPNIYGSIAAKLAGIEEVYPTINGLGYAYTGNSIKNRAVRMITSILYFIAFKCSKKVFFQNSDDVNELVKRKLIKLEKCVVIAGSGIDLIEFEKRNQPNKFSFIMVTRLLKTKGVYEYLEAARRVKQHYPDIHIKLVGPLDPNPDGVKKEELQTFIDEGVIDYLGVSDDVHTLLAESSVFVLPSYYREGVPHSILEAMATGRAIITTDSPGCRETVKEGVNGFLIPTKDARALSEKMMWMIDNHEATKMMGDESFKYAKEKFDVEKVNEKMFAIMKIQ
jgi:glycosyltransferase involved in cell wall biosynthesis